MKTTAIFLIMVVVHFFYIPANAQLLINGTSDPLLLAQQIAGNGVLISNAVFTGDSDAAGAFSSSGTNLGFTSGILLTTGNVAYAPGPNISSSTSADNSAPGDSDLSSICGCNTFDGCSLQFDLQPSGDTLRFSFVFASEEYNDFVGQPYNDMFAIFISGPGIIGAENIPLIPGTTDLVAINSVNCTHNDTFYVCNDPFDLGECTDSNGCPANPGGTTIEYDGFTKVITASAIVVANETYHLKIAIADVADPVYDSGVFIDAGSLVADGVKENYTAFHGLNIFPDPVHDALTISGVPNKKNELRVVNSLGNEVLHQVIQPSTNQLRINVSFLPKGVYFISCRSEGTGLNSSFVKQ